MRALPPICALLAATFAATLAAQTAPQQPPDQAPFTFRANSNLVLVPVQVETRHGDMLYDLSSQQFVLEDNGVPQTIRVDQDTDALGLSLVVVVQCSRQAFTQFSNMRGLTSMVDDVTGGGPHQVALVSYGSEVELLAPLSNSDKKLADGFANFEPCDDEKDAVTLDAIAYANKLLDSAPPGNRRAILLIGETRDHGSKIKPAEVIAALGRSNTVVDSVSFNPGKDDLLGMLHGAAPNPKEAILLLVNALRRNVPHTLSSVTGGEYTNFNSQKGFEKGVHRLANHIHNYYLLSFQPAGANSAPVTPGLHRIIVKIPDYPDAHIRFRLTYYAGDAPPPDIPETSEPPL